MNLETLIGQIFKACYFPLTYVVEVALGHNPSFV